MMGKKLNKIQILKKHLTVSASHTMQMKKEYYMFLHNNFIQLHVGM